MDRKIYMNNLYDYYGELLTDKQRKYFEDYYFNDLSLGEISSNMDVSRNAVYNELKSALDRLEFYEEVLHLYEKSLRIKSLIRNLDSELILKIEELI